MALRMSRCYFDAGLSDVYGEIRCNWTIPYADFRRRIGHYLQVYLIYEMRGRIIIAVCN